MKRTIANHLAAALSQSRISANRAGRVLHDQVGPLLMGAGLQLQLLTMDRPETAAALEEALRALDQAMEHLRQVSQSLAPSPVYRLGFEGALRKMLEDRQPQCAAKLTLKYSARARVGVELGVTLYEAVESALEDALHASPSKVLLSVTGTREISVRVHDDGRPDGRRPGISRLLGEAAGVVFSRATGKGTIVLINHGISRPSRG